ncbi:33029_t:CDS:2 [Gigaspora margarita]|uniref:33029_t:CDS:1 n=1 Tax=Gigaspora margarita TaxID=4874 RepID=A0ABN7VP02_GIGMA|nr:33029_t:CDS:2 [Gigaspora margarita]
MTELPKISGEWLIKLDIDGTSTNPDFTTLNQNLKKVLQNLIAQGHKICFTTGRNYLSALPFYQEVGLDTFLVTYNGAYINNPSDKDGEIVMVNPIMNEVVKNILNEPIIKQNLRNVLVDKVDRTTISTSDDVYYQEIFFNGNSYTKGEDILQLLGQKDALQLVLEFPNQEEVFNKILMMLRSKYSAAITFYFGDKLKAQQPGEKILVPDPERKIIKIRNKFAKLMHTVKGIAMADSIPHLKAYAYGITDLGKTNSDGSFFVDLKNRGITAGLANEENFCQLRPEEKVIYLGIDCTAESLHIGHLFLLFQTIRFARAGFRVLLVLGGATSKIGDPSDKLQERPQLSSKKLVEYEQAIKSQLERIFFEPLKLTGLNFAPLETFYADQPELLEKIYQVLEIPLIGKNVEK